MKLLLKSIRNWDYDEIGIQNFGGESVVENCRVKLAEILIKMVELSVKIH